MWKIQLTITINFISYKVNDKDNDKEHIRLSKSDNKETMINDKAGEVVEELFQ